MRTLTKLMCLVIVVFMLLSLAACGNSPAKEPAKSSSATSAAAATKADAPAATKADDGQWKPKTDLSKHVTMSMASVQGIEGFDYTKGDGLAKYYSQKFNYTLNVTALNFDNWNERLRIWINSGDMPDICVYNYNHPDAAGFVEQELVKKLPNDWKTRWPNEAKVFETTTLGPEMEKRFKGTYFLPRARFYNNLLGDPLPNHFSLYMRKDWAEAVGFPIKLTYKTSEMIQFGKLMKEKDPGKLGEKLVPVAEAPNTAVELFVGRNSTHYKTFYKDKDGKYKWGGAAEDTLKGLKLFSEAFNSGVLSKEFYTRKTDEDTRQFDTQGIAAATYGSAPTAAIPTVYQTNFEKNVKLDPFKSISMATILGEDGNFHQEDLINFWGTIIFNPKIDNAKFERWMDVLDYNATREGSIITNMGVKDEDWTYDGNNKIKSLFDKSSGKPLGGTTGKYPSLGYLLGITILFDDFAFDNPNNDQRLRDLSRQLYTDRCKIATPDTFTKTDWDLYTFDSPSRRKVSFDYTTELCNLVTMPGDIEANWKKWVDSKMPMIQPVLDELNSKLGKK